MPNMESAHWTRSIPWWLGWLFVGGFGLAGAFGSTVLPLNFQLAGFVIGCAAMFVAAAGTVMHLVNEWRTANSRERVQLEPLHLIIVGLLITVICGVIWWPRTKPIVLNANFTYHGLDEPDTTTVSIDYSIYNDNAGEVIVNDLPIASIVAVRPSTKPSNEQWQKNSDGKEIIKLIPSDINYCYDTRPEAIKELRKH